MSAETSAPAAEPYSERCAQIVSMVFETMLGLTVSPLPQGETVPPPVFTSAIYFVGAWKGALLFECTAPDAFALTAHLMSIPEPKSFDDDVRDSLGEIVNMIGGNFKALLPQGTMLSMPSVIEGRQYSLRLPAVPVAIETLQFSGNPMAVTLVKMPEDGR
jgi:chemotaxis protein CheX